MQSRLIVKNFGPIKSVDLDLRNVNVFIGPQATGKSALAKLYTIVKAPRKFLFKSLDDFGQRRFLFNVVDEVGHISLDKENGLQEFEAVLEEYNIDSFLTGDTEISFHSNLHSFHYHRGKIDYDPQLHRHILYLESLLEDFENNERELKEAFEALSSSLLGFNFKALSFISDEKKRRNPFFLTMEMLEECGKSTCVEFISIIRKIEEDLSENAAMYIPAERNFINIIRKYSLSLQKSKVPIPQHILSFGSELEKLDIKELDLGFLQKELLYRSVNGEDRIFINKTHSIMLTEAASGIQSVVPILLPIDSLKSNIEHRSLVIEEPELNLFPNAQYDLIKRLESSRREEQYEDFGTIHTYTTHSPYILSALNNLLYADKVLKELMSKGGKTDSYESWEKSMSAVHNIVSANIDPDSFTAYQICNGNAESIFDRKTGLMMENYIDMATDKLNDDFESLMDLLG